MTRIYDTGAESAPKSIQTQATGSIAIGRTVPELAMYLPSLVPVIFFLVSLYIRPTMNPDVGVGFLAFRDMLVGGPFNGITQPDPANIANDTVTFISWWSPGQYLVPGAF